MKKTILIIFLAIGITAIGQINRIGFNQDEDFKIVTFFDPTFDDAGYHFGLGIRKELVVGWVGFELSTNQGLNPAYYDLVGQGGVILNINRIDILAGGRLGNIRREGNGYPLAGMIMIFEYNITQGIALGARFWVDQREDQADNAYGDSSGYKKGIIFTNPMSQENAAIVLTFKIN